MARPTRVLGTGFHSVADDETAFDPPVLIAGDRDSFVLYAYSDGGEDSDRIDGVMRVTRGRAKELAAGRVDALAAASGRAAIVPTGRQLVRILRIADAKVLGEAQLPAEFYGLALSDKLLVLLTTGDNGYALALFRAADAAPVKVIDLPAEVHGAHGPMSIAGARLTLLVDGRFQLVDLERLTISPTAAPRHALGLSIEGNRIAWAYADRIHVIDLAQAR